MNCYRNFLITAYNTKMIGKRSKNVTRMGICNFCFIPLNYRVSINVGVSNSHRSHLNSNLLPRTHIQRSFLKLNSSFMEQYKSHKLSAFSSWISLRSHIGQGIVSDESLLRGSFWYKNVRAKRFPCSDTIEFPRPSPMNNFKPLNRLKECQSNLRRF